MKNKQKRFINEMIENVKQEILRRAESIPEEWDGIELRWLIRDHFNLIAIEGVGSNKRKRDYNNEVLVKNLV